MQLPSKLIFLSALIAFLLVTCDLKPRLDDDTDTEADTDTDTDTAGEVVPREWITIPTESFWMGSPDGDCPTDYPDGTECTSELGRRSDEDLHYVQLSGNFLIMSTEVTQGDFAATMGWNPSEFGPNGTYGECGLDCPVEGVSWYDAVAYANELSKDASLTPCYILSNVFCEKGATRTDATNYMACFDGSEAMSGGITSATVELNGVTSVYDCEGYRLPTEAEWEYAARAGTTTAFYNGGITNTDRIPLDPNLDAIGWYGGNSSYKSGGWACRGYHSGATYCGPQPVGGKPANAFGLCDMSGNVWEWVWDWYESSYPEGNTSSPVEDPTGPTSAPTRVARGGGWNTYASLCRAARRSNPSPRGRHFSVGFRLARSLP